MEKTPSANPFVLNSSILPGLKPDYFFLSCLCASAVNP